MRPLAPLVPSIAGTPSASLSVNPRSDGAISHFETEMSQLNPDRSRILHSTPLRFLSRAGEGL